MASYTSNLKDWGATGSEYPNGYSYKDGEQPVDAWDNFLTDNLIQDTKHLVSVTNSRIESDKGAGSTRPSSPESSHLFHNQDTGRLEVYDGSSWHELLRRDGGKMQGGLDMNQFHLYDSGGTLTINSETTLNGNDLKGVRRLFSATQYAALETEGTGSASWEVYDSANGQPIFYAREGGNVEVPNGQLTEMGNRVATRSWVNNNADVPNADFADRAKRSAYLRVNKNGGGVETGISSGGRWWMAPRDGNGNELWQKEITFDPPLGQWKIEGTPRTSGGIIATRNWVDNSADVPNADYADNAGDADTLDGKHASEVKKSADSVQKESLAHNDGFAPNFAG